MGWYIQRGFERFFGSTNGMFDYFSPKPNQTYMNDAEVLKPFKPEDGSNYYTTDAFTTKAIEYLDKYKDDENPFFLYVAYNAPHFPLQAWPEDISKYRGKYMQGWDKIREDRFKRQKKMGLIKPEWRLPERDPYVCEWDKFNRKDDADLTMATYAAMIDRLDQNIGRLLSKLKEIGKDENTLIIFLSDNGACAEGHMWDGKDAKSKPGSPNSFAFLGREWAYACNTPFRDFKRSTFNGGQLTPFIARWPNTIKNKGAITFQKGHIADIMPTLCELANAQYPEGETWEVAPEGNLETKWTILPMVGKSLLPIFQNQHREQKNKIMGHFQGSRMIIADDWKLVSKGGDGAILHLYEYPWELYDLKIDGTETNNLVNEHLAFVDSLDAIYREWIDKADSLTGIKGHEYFQPRFNKEQKKACVRLENDEIQQLLLKNRREIGLAIVEHFRQEKIKFRTTLGMDKIPMSYFGVVEAGREYFDVNEQLKNLYVKWDENIAYSKQHCENLGPVFLEVWEIQEKIRLRTSALEVN